MRTFISKLLAIMVISASIPFYVSAEELLKDRISMTGISELSVEMISVDIEAIPSGGQLVVERIGVPAEIEISVQRLGGSLKIVQKPHNFNLPLLKSGKIRITTPQASLRIVLHSTSGDIDVQRLASTSLGLRSTSGSISLTACPGPIEAITTSGDISLTQCAGSKTLESTSGSIHVEGREGQIKASSTSGDIELRSTTGDAEIDAISGGISFLSVTGKLEATTISGDIDGSGVVLMGDSSFETTSGDISLSFLNRESELRFDLNSTSGTLAAAGTRSKGHLSGGKGTITVKGSSISGNQEFKTR